MPALPAEDPGGLFMLGIYGKKATRQTLRLLEATGAGGVLLLARNIESPAQVRRLTRDLTRKLGRPLLFAIDHEGGWVLRFKDGVTAFPGNAALGRAGEPKLAYAVGRQMALELSGMGIGLNLAPVLDVAGPRYNPGIGIRSFGSDPKLVSRLGCAFFKGLQDHGVSACAKHFPGKGAATVDAHVELPTISLPRAQFERTHLAPFAAAVKAGVASVMTSHVRFPALDGAPASFSSKITRGLLRERLGFKGAIISDDLCMGAVSTRGPIPEAAAASFAAGHDIIMVAHETLCQRESVDWLRSRAAAGLLPPGEVSASRRRIETLLKRAARPSASPSAAAGAALSALIARKAVEVIQKGSLPLPLSGQGRPPLILLPDFTEVKDRFTFENGPLGSEKLVRAFCARRGGARIWRAPVQSRDIGALGAAIKDAGLVIFFCFEARRFAGQQAALDLLNKQAPEKTVACLIRSSWDRESLDRRMTAVDARGYRLSQLEAALDVILGPEAPR